MYYPGTILFRAKEHFWNGILEKKSIRTELKRGSEI